MGLIGGENLANRGVTPPAITMWIPNVVFTMGGMVLFSRMGREVATIRGGGWDDLRYAVGRWWRSRSGREQATTGE